MCVCVCTCVYLCVYKSLDRMNDCVSTVKVYFCVIGYERVRSMCAFLYVCECMSVKILACTCKHVLVSVHGKVTTVTGKLGGEAHCCRV